MFPREQTGIAGQDDKEQWVHYTCLQKLHVTVFHFAFAHSANLLMLGYFVSTLIAAHTAVFFACACQGLNTLNVHYKYNPKMGPKQSTLKQGASSKPKAI